MKVDRNYAVIAAAQRKKHLIHIISEGSSREPEYFGCFAKGNTRIHFQIIEHNSQEDNSPEGLVRKAKEYKRNLAKNHDIQVRRFDQFWIVLDVDSWKDLPKTVQSANACGWHVAISNPCFEVWLYYHYFENLPQIDISTWTGDDWKQHLNTEIAGGFDSRKDYLKYVEAARRSYENCRMNGIIPEIGSTTVYKIFDNFV